MSKKGSAFAAVLCAAALYGTSAHAAVKSIDLGTLAADTSTAYSGTTGTGSFTVYEKFSSTVAPIQLSVSFGDTVRNAANAITGGFLSLYSCLTNCTGTTQAPTGTLLASAPIINFTSNVQSAGFGPITGTVIPYYLKIEGSTTARGAGVTYAGTISLDSVGAVPEPSTWAMMLLGFAGLAFAYGRSNQTRAAVV